MELINTRINRLFIDQLTSINQLTDDIPFASYLVHIFSLFHAYLPIKIRKVQYTSHALAIIIENKMRPLRKYFRWITCSMP